VSPKTVNTLAGPVLALDLEGLARLLVIRRPEAAVVAALVLA
jgi:hypothetical protein